MKKVLLSWMMLLGLVGAAHADQVLSYGPDEEITALEEGTIVAIYDATNDKFLYGAGAQNLGYDGAANAFIQGNAGWLFKVEKYDGHYMFHLQTPAGEDYSVWGKPGYLNSQPANGSVSFILGLGTNHGEDGENLALWDLEKAEGGGYLLKNVGTELYLKDVTPAKYEAADATTWTFCTLKEAYIENPIAPSTYSATDANTEIFANFITIDDGATWDPETKTFTKRCGFKWADGIDLSDYRYIVFTAAQSRENAGAGNMIIRDASGKTIQGDDYKGGPYGMWFSTWNALNSCVIDIESLRSTRMFDIYNVTELSIDGGDGFILGNIYATNFETATTGRWASKDNEGNFRVKGLSAGQYGTVCLPYQAAVSGAYVYSIAGKTEDGISLSPVDGLLEAGQPYIFKPLETLPNGDGVYPANTVYFYQTTAATVDEAGSDNGLVGTFEALSDDVYVVVAKNEDGESELQNATSVGANQAYIDFETIDGAGDETDLIYVNNEIEEPEPEPAYVVGDELAEDFATYTINDNGTTRSGNAALKEYEWRVSNERYQDVPDGFTDDDGTYTKVYVRSLEQAQAAGNATMEGDHLAGWDSQFFVSMPSSEVLSAGDKIKLTMKVKADVAATFGTQSHAAAGGYIHWYCVGDVACTTEWKEVSGEAEVMAGKPNSNGGLDFDWGKAAEGMYTIAFNLSTGVENTYYFKDIKIEVTKAEIVENWVDIAEEATFYKTEEGVGGPWAVSPEDGVYSVQSGAYKWTDWDTQFFVRLPKVLVSGTKYKVSFDYMASQAGGADTQGHFEPGQYKWYTFIGSPSFTTSWQNYESEGSIDNNLNGVYTIAFNLSKNGAETTFNIKNFKFEVPEGTELEAAPDVPGSLTKPESATFKQAIDGFATMVPEYSMDISGNENIEAYKVEYDSEKGCVALEATTELMSARAILVKANAGDYTDGITMKRIDNAGNGLKNGDNGNTKGDGKTWYVLANGDSGIGFYLLAEGTEVPKGKGYLVIEAAEGREFIGFADDATTVKVVENLKKSGIIYNLAGQQVKNAKKGLYIIDGKKVMK